MPHNPQNRPKSVSGKIGALPVSPRPTFILNMQANIKKWHGLGGGIDTDAIHVRDVDCHALLGPLWRAYWASALRRYLSHLRTGGVGSSKRAVGAGAAVVAVRAVVRGSLPRFHAGIGGGASSSLRGHSSLSFLGCGLRDAAFRAFCARMWATRHGATLLLALYFARLRVDPHPHADAVGEGARTSGNSTSAGCDASPPDSGAY
jgi:hypothetical protein